MHFELTEEQRAIASLARDFAEKRLAAVQEADEPKHLFRREVVSEMGKLGLLATLLPEEYGGTNMGFMSTVLIIEEMARVCVSYCLFPMSQVAGPALTILKYGTSEQKTKYIAGLASGDILSCFGATEPDSGSDVAGMKMTAIEKEGYFVLNGTKVWITNGPVADVGLFWVYTDRSLKHKGISCFIVDLKNTPGISTRPFNKLGLWCTVTGEVAFDDVRIPQSCLLGPKGEGFRILTEMLGNTRLCVAARAIGLSRACLEDSIKYAKERHAFGQPIANFQMIQDQIAEMHIEHQAATALTYQAAANRDRGINDMAELSTAKYFATRTAVKAADTALEIHGSYGYSMDFRIQRYIRDSRSFPITEGTSNIQKIIIARSLLK